MEMFNLNNIAGVAIISSIVAGWNQIKAFLYKIVSFFIRTDTLDGINIDKFEFILENSKILRWGNGIFKKQFYYFDGNKIKTYVIKTEKSIFCLYKGYIPILITKKFDGLSFTYIYKTFDLTSHITEIIKDLNDLYKTVNRKRSKTWFTIYKETGTLNSLKQSNSLGTPETAAKTDARVNVPTAAYNSGASEFDRIYELKQHSVSYGIGYDEYAEDTKVKPDEYKPHYYWSEEAIKLSNEIQFWLNSKGWYNSKRITWKRGALLAGIPGGGKSKMVLECAMKHDLPVTILDIGSMSNEDFVAAMRKKSQDYGIFLIEDIDAVFEGRNNMRNEGSAIKNGLTFECLINTIGGIEFTDGVFLIITTNRPEILDPALLRDGRMDLHLTIGPLPREGRVFIANNILSDWPELIEDAVNNCEECTAAQFENACIKLAVKKHNETHNLNG